MLSDRTTREYALYIKRWEDLGMPDPKAFLELLPSDHTRRNARAALQWHFRMRGQTLRLPPVPKLVKVPSALTREEYAAVRDAAFIVSPRCGYALEFLYATGARVSEACAVAVEDVTVTHVILRQTKRRPGGMRVERAIPLGPVGRRAVEGLLACGPGRVGTLVGVTPNTLEEWFRRVSVITGIRVHPHKLRATFATHLLQRGVDIRTVQDLMGHTDLQTTMRYLAVTDEGRLAAVERLG